MPRSSERVAAGTPLLQVRDVAVEFRTVDGTVHAVEGVDLDLAAGETLAIVGESGSGKSTTAMAVIGLLPGNGRVTKGSILFEGEDLVGAPESVMRSIRGASIGLVPQDPMSNLNPVAKIGTQVAETLLAHGLATRKNVDRRVVETLAAAGLPDAAERAKQYPHEFSGGMRQRALIAIGLACNPKLLIADEPTSALDVTVQRTILDQLERMTGELGTALMLITHDLGLAAERASRVVVMHRGRIVEQGLARQILEDPQQPYTQALVKAAPSVAAVRLRPEAFRKLTSEEPMDAAPPVSATPDGTPAVVVEPAKPADTAACRGAGLHRRGGGTHQGIQDPREQGGLRRGQRHLLRDPPRRNGRHRRRIGFGQDDDRPHGAQGGRSDRGRDPLRREGRREPEGQAAELVPAAGAADLPGPVLVAEPDVLDRAPDPGAAGLLQARLVEGAPGPRAPAARRCGTAPVDAAALSLRALGRSAPTRRDRASTRPVSRPDRVRRARLGPRRPRAGPDPAPARRPAARVRPELPLHLARPRRRPTRSATTCAS